MGMIPVTHDERRIPIACPTCRGAGSIVPKVAISGGSPRLSCSTCLSAGWVWSGDNRPPTLCPGGGKNPVHNLDARGPDPLPCGRSGRTCPGCDRDTDAIGGPEDVEFTMNRVRGGEMKDVPDANE